MIAERHRGASSRLSGAMRGLIAGAAGTCALNTVTHIDMLVRGRPPSELPAQVAARIAERAEIDLARADPDAAKHRQSALGALLGYGTGAVVSVACGLARALDS